MDYLFLDIINSLKNLSPEFLLFIGFLVCCLFIILSLRFFGLIGLVCYSVIAVIVSNIQVLKLGKFSLFNEPVALGTIVFTSLFITSDIITEHYGAKNAKKSVLLGFFMQIFIIFTMLPVIAHPETLDKPSAVQNALETLFSPSLRILIASIFSFVISQYIDISIFSFFKKQHGQKLLWLRANVSTFISGLFDNVIFSLLAWIILAKEPLPLNTVILGFIGFSQAVRVIVSVVSTPLLYLSYKFKPNEI